MDSDAPKTLIEHFSILEDPRDPSKCRHKLIEIAMALAISLLLYLLSYSPPYRRLELLSLDALFNLRPPITENRDVATIDIDEKNGKFSYTRLGSQELIDVGIKVTKTAEGDMKMDATLGKQKSEQELLKDILDILKTVKGAQ